MRPGAAARVRVCHLISSLDVGGAEMTLLRLLSGIDGDRFESRVVSLIRPGPVADKIRRLGVPVVSLHMRRGRASLRALILLVRLLRRERSDVLQTWLYHADLLGLAARRMAGRPCLVWNVRSSDMDMTRYRWLSGATVRACARFSRLPAAVIVNSVAGRRFHEGIGYRPARWELIPNGVDTRLFRPDAEARSTVRRELGVPDDTILIGLIARLDPMKDHATFFRAAGELVRRKCGAHFILIGEGVERGKPEVESWMAENGLVGRAHLLGRREDVPRLAAALDVGTLASCTEGFPGAVAEAMACGVPCVVTDAGDAGLIVGDTGVVVPPRDAVALAGGWEHLLQRGEEARRAMGDRARARIEHEFSLARMVRAYETLYSSLVAA